MDRLNSAAIDSDSDNDGDSTVVHLVGRVNETVFRFLGPATRALAERGFRQTVILIDEPKLGHVLPSFHASVRLVLTPPRGGPLREMQNSLDALYREAAAGPVGAVHLHGFLPCLLAVYAARFRGLPCKLFFSPYHSAGAPSRRWAGALLLALLRRAAGVAAPQLLVPAGADADAVPLATRQAAALIESPVESAFFEVPRHEARRPLVVAGNRAPDPRSAARFAQLAVLLADETQGLAFNWIGTADPGSLARLKAANVGVFDIADPADRAARLAAGWLYLAPDAAPSLARFLAEAMAVGLPCVAWDTPHHRHLLRHDETGLLCRSEEELLLCITRLIDSPELRLRLGSAARDEAERRFDRTHFGASLLAAYGLPSGPL